MEKIEAFVEVAKSGAENPLFISAIAFIILLVVSYGIFVREGNLATLVKVLGEH
jgi:hypothetical protein